MPNEEMMAEFHARGGEKPRRKRTKTGALKRGKRPNRSTPKAQLDDAYWQGMKAMALYLLGPDAVCSFCEKPLHDDLIDAHHLHHKGRGGRSAPENLGLAHRRCHRAHHGEPRWGEAS